MEQDDDVMTSWGELRSPRDTQLGDFDNSMEFFYYFEILTDRAWDQSEHVGYDVNECGWM